MLKIKTRIASVLGSLLRATGMKRFVRNQDGVAAVEFALIAIPFFALLLAIFEIAFVILAQQVLQTAVTKSARLIMTGQAQTQSMTATQFQQNVCANVTILSCGSVYVNVQKFTSFSTISPLNPLQSGNFNSGSLSYNTGTPGDIMLVQVFYQLPVFVTPLGLNLSNMNGNMRLLVATAVFRNEPY